MQDVPQYQTKPMDEVALIAAIDDADNRSYGSNLSNLTAELSAQRALSIDLYLGKDIDPPPDGQSSVIDRTVFETVQWMLPSLCRIFANGEDIVTLLPLNKGDVEQAKQESAYLNWLVTVKHPWFDIFLEFATDALLTKNAYILVYADRNLKVEIERYQEQTAQGVSFLLQDPSVQVIESQEYIAQDLPPEPLIGPQGPVLGPDGQPIMQPAKLYDLIVRRTNTEKDVCIRVLPPERCKVDQRSFSWRLDDKCNYFEYWEEVTLTELREQGYQISTDIADDPEIYTQEDYARDQFGERRLERYKPSDPSMRRVKARMIWIRVDADGDGIAELLQITRVGRHILYKEEVSRIPVASGVACPLPHRHVGISIGDMTQDIQRIKTTLLRQGMDSIYASLYPQKIVNENFVNMDDVMVRRPDGVIRSTDINQIRYEEVPFVLPQAIQGLEYMDQVRENRTGVNNGFMGIDISTLNNAQPGTVNQMSAMGAQRVEQVARILAFAIEDLFSIVHEQILKLGHKRQTVQLMGQWVDVDPGAWRKRTDFKTCVAFSAGNRDAQIQRLMLILQQQKELVQLGLPVASPENIYNTLVELAKVSDFAAPDRFWTDPKTIPPKAPQPPEGIIKEGMSQQGEDRRKAADIMQRDIESQRKFAIDKYAIDASNGLAIVHKQLDHEHAVALESLRSGHAALIDGMNAKIDGANAASMQTSHAVEDAKKGIQEHAASVVQVKDALGDVLHHIKKMAAHATAKKVLRKNDKGHVEGMDLVDHEGNVLASHKAVRDEKGNLVGMQ